MGPVVRFLAKNVVFLLLLASCSTSREIVPSPDDKHTGEVEYSAVYVIHGDSDYLYHDPHGEARQADQKVLNEAMMVGENAKNGEVLIFHQRPEKKVFWLFPKKDRQFYHFRKGELIRKQKYSPRPDSGLLSSESKLYRHYRTPTTLEKPVIFLYFGHEIPYRDGAGYFHSMPGLKFNTDLFARSISPMTNGSDQFFDLMVLSTCNNATPWMVESLKPFTATLLASPQNLHLSHIDTEAIMALEEENISSFQLAELMARRTYRRMEQNIQTVISLSVFDMDQLDTFLLQAAKTYKNYLQDTRPETTAENVDCVTLETFGDEWNYSRGVSRWYRAPRFGKKAGNTGHSGWGCKK